jgi:hypothetical protein
MDGMTTTTGAAPEAPRGLTARQKRALPIVFAARTLTQGCKEAGIGRTTWWTWQKGSTAFRQALRALEDSAIKEAHARLRAGALQAQETLAKLLDSANEGIRLQAATMILRLGKEVVSHDLLERIEALEAGRSLDAETSARPLRFPAGGGA